MSLNKVNDFIIKIITLALIIFTQVIFAGSLSYPVTCPNALNKHTGINCGYIIVPEQHSLRNSKQIKIFFVNAKSIVKNARPDPIFYLAGGPGVAPSSNLNAILNEIAFIRINHDVILVDERGTGFSTPNLSCNFPSPLYPLYLTENKIKSILKSCKEHYKKEGINISSFNTYENAQDIIALANHLNVNSWNILGNSYGTRLALAISQFKPNGLRSIVLDSALDLNPFNINDIGNSISSGYERFFSDYPSLKKQFVEIVESLPQSVTEKDQLYLTGQAVIYQNAGLAMGTSKQRKVAAELIKSLHDDYKSGTLTLDEFMGLYKIKAFPVDLGAMKIVTCYDEQSESISRWQQQQIELANKKYPYFYVNPNDYGVSSLDCQVLGHGDALSNIRKEFITTIPVMILHGNNDTIPLYISENLLKSLKNANLYTFTNMGHHVFGSSDCAKSLIEKFFNEPNKWPIDKCHDSSEQAKAQLN